METRGPKEVGPRGQIPWPRGTPYPGPRASDAVDLRPRAFVDLKTTIKIVPRRLSEGSAAETQNHETEDLELQIGGGKLRRGAVGVVSIFSNISTIVTMMKGEYSTFGFVVVT